MRPVIFAMSASVVVSGVITGCVGVEQTAVVVELEADASVRMSVQSVRVVVRSGAVRDPRRYQVYEREDFQWPLAVPLQPANSESLDADFQVVFEAFDGAGGTGRLVSSRLLRGQYLPGVVGYFHLTLDALCADVLCNEVRDETCYQGECVSGDRGQPTELYAPEEDPR